MKFSKHENSVEDDEEDANRQIRNISANYG